MPNRQSADQMDPEATLAGQIAAGDSEAWATFFDHYFTWAYQFAHRHLDGNRGDAEDLCSRCQLWRDQPGEFRSSESE